MYFRSLLMMALVGVSVVLLSRAWKYRTERDRHAAELSSAKEAGINIGQDLLRWEKRHALTLGQVTAIDAKRGASEVEPPVAGISTQELASRLLDSYRRDLQEASDPKRRAQEATRFKATLRTRYFGLYVTLGLGPEQIARFENLMTERNSRSDDIRLAASALRMEPTHPDIVRLLEQETKDLQVLQLELLGAEKFAVLTEYGTTEPERRLAAQVAGGLLFSSAPLSVEQKQRLIQVLIDCRDMEGTRGNTVNGPRAMAEARAFLSSAQLDELGSSLASAEYSRLAQLHIAQVYTWLLTKTVFAP